MTPYDKSPMTDLTDEELDALLAMEGMTPITDINKQTIKVRTLEEADAVAPQAGRRKRKRGALVAGVMVAAVALFGFAQRDRIAEYYNLAFGNSNFAAYAQTIGSVSEIDGIEMRVLSALRDGDTTHFLVDVRDVSGQNRISQDVHVDSWNLESARKSGISGGGCQVIAYDEKSATATLMVSAIGEYANSDVVFHLQSFVSGGHSNKEQATGISLYDMLKTSPATFQAYDKSEGFGGGVSQEAIAEGFALEKVVEVLSPNLNATVIGTDRLQICGVAMDGAGFLHVLYAMPKAESDLEAYFLSLVDRTTGEKIESYYSLSLPNAYDGQTMTRRGEIEEVFDWRGKTMEDVQKYWLLYDNFYYDNIFEGDWSVKFTTPEDLKSIKLSGDMISMNHGQYKINSMLLTPMALEIEMPDVFKSQAFAEMTLDDAISVLYQDGRVKEINNEGMYSESEGNGGSIKVSFRMYIPNISNVSALQIGDVVYPIQ